MVVLLVGMMQAKVADNIGSVLLADSLPNEYVIFC